VALRRRHGAARTLGIAFCLLPALLGAAGVASPTASSPGTNLACLLDIAGRSNPRVLAAGRRIDAATARALSLDGLYDPVLHATAGRADTPARAARSPLPATPAFGVLAAEGGFSAAVRGGARLDATLTRWQALDRSDGDDFHDAAGVGLDVPLVRDRGFRSQDWRVDAAARAVDAARARAEAEWQDTCREVTRAYADWLLALAERTESERALGRVTNLLAEAEERERLAVIPAYQLHTTRMEVSLRREDLRQSLASLQQARLRLAETVGADLPADLAATDGELQAWAAACAAGRTGTLARAAAARTDDLPELRAAAAEVAAAEARIRLAREDLRPDVSLVAGVGCALDDGPDAGSDDATVGWEVSAVWRRAWERVGERAALDAATADRDAAAADRRTAVVAAVASLGRAREALQSASERLDLVDAAVAEARLSLEAEGERFRLGDGRSRNVLDAQKDLTAAVRRANAAAADTARAFADLVRAAGLPLAPLPPTLSTEPVP
jgi:outer membrane protein TolC